MEHQVIAGPPGQHIVIAPPETDAEVRALEDEVRAAQLPRSPEPSAAALAQVAADLEGLDEASPEDELDALLAGLPEPEPERVTSGPWSEEAIAAFEESPLADLARTLEERRRPVAEALVAEFGPQGAGEKLGAARRAIATLGRADPALLEAAEEVGLDHSPAAWKLLAEMGEGKAQGKSWTDAEVTAFEDTAALSYRQFAALVHQHYPDVTAALVGEFGRHGVVGMRLADARKAIAHLARTQPQVLLAIDRAGLDQRSSTWKALAAYGQKLGKRNSKMHTMTKPAGDAGATRVDSPDETAIRAQLEHAMKDPKYWDSARRDPAYVRKIEQGFQRLYGGQK
jgi:hypothetical protein